jgi:FSR family fosmidomycin resistance protein-like MFS transporter
VRRHTSILVLATGHACVDIYQGAVAALVPFFIAEREYTYATASGIVLAATVLSSIAQPLFGLLTDRWAMPWLIPAATLTGGLGVALSGLSGSYGLTLLFAAVSGVGVAAYHPEAARVARRASAGSHQAMAWFSTGGNVGFALAPLLVAAFIATGGLRWTPFLVLPALVGIAITVPVLDTMRRSDAAGRSAHLPAGRDDVPAFLRLSLAVVFRSIAFVGLSTFIALYAQQRVGGGSEVGTAALFLLFLGGVIGSILGGSLAQRWGRVIVSLWSYGLTAFAIAGVVWMPGPAVFVFIAAASVGLYVPFSLQITLGQDYLPSRIGTASGVTIGLTVSIGGLASPVLGAIADAASLQLALVPLIAMPVLSLLMFRTLPEPTVDAPADPTAADSAPVQAPVHPTHPGPPGT